MIAEAVRQLPVESLIIDGEAVCLREDGHPDFYALRSKHSCKDARLMAFDFLSMNGIDYRPLPLHERRRLLALLVEGADDHLWFSGHVEGDQGEALFRHACANNLEGIVSKRIYSRYRSGASKDWLKIKFSDYRR